MAPPVNPPRTSTNPTARPDDSRPARTPNVVEERTWAAGSAGKVAEATPRADALDAKWQSAIDAATD